MSISDIKPGGWAAKERLTSGQANLARTELIKCVDGTGGGTYTPSATISIDDLTIGGTERLKYASRSVTRSPINYMAGWTSDATRWAMTAVSQRPYWEQPNYGNANLLFQMSLPVGSVLTSATAEIIGYSHAGVPNSPVSFEIYYSAFDGFSKVALGTSTDPSASAGAYDAIHNITLSGLSHTVLSTLMYWVRFTGESGANAAVGTRMLSFTSTVTMTAQDEWIGG